MALPARTAVLNYLCGIETVNAKEVMAALRPIYGSEGQFNEKLFQEHLMALEANGLVELAAYDLGEHEELNMQYRITEEGRSTVEKYVSAEYRK